MQRQRLLASLPVQPMETMTAACARQRQGVSVHTRYPSYLFPPLPSLPVGREGRAMGWKPLPPAACPRSVTDLGPTAGRSPEAESASCCGSTRGAKEQSPNQQAGWEGGKRISWKAPPSIKTVMEGSTFHYHGGDRARSGPRPTERRTKSLGCLLSTLTTNVNK